MNKHFFKRNTFGILMLLLSLNHTALASDPKPSEKGNGVFTQRVGGSGGIFFTVDTVSKICFASPGGGAALTVIDCKKLKERTEWQEIINW